MTEITKLQAEIAPLIVHLQEIRTSLSYLDDAVRAAADVAAEHADVSTDDDNQDLSDKLYDEWVYTDDACDSMQRTLATLKGRLDNARNAELARERATATPPAAPAAGTGSTAAYKVPEDAEKLQAAIVQSLESFASDLPYTIESCFYGTGSIPFGEFIRNVARWQILDGRAGSDMDTNLRKTIAVLQDILDGKLDLTTLN